MKLGQLWRGDRGAGCGAEGEGVCSCARRAGTLRHKGAAPAAARERRRNYTSGWTDVKVEIHNEQISEKQASIKGRSVGSKLQHYHYWE
mgnify:CR=1 FL=1